MSLAKSTSCHPALRIGDPGVRSGLLSEPIVSHELSNVAVPAPAFTPEPQEPRSAPPLPELLAPAGDWECARAAVENGADAIYFGLDRFNARMRADNFTEADLRPLMEFLHRRGVKGYVTLNTLVFQNELSEAEHYLRTMIAAGVDAVIVQDVGICQLIRRLSPDFPIHASTQMTITSARGVAFAGELGCRLVVLARECSSKEIGLIQAAQGDDAGRRCPSKSSSTAPYASRTRVNASPAKPLAAAPPTAANARRRAGCHTS